jgi:glycosyltransferase involved in cell wall biosynthesis
MIENKPKITILSQYFYPEVASTGQLMTELALGLKERGCDVRIVTGQPSYIKGVDKLQGKEIYQGVEIKRTWNTRFDKNKKVGRILNLCSFFISTFVFLLFTKEKRPLLIVSVPPFAGVLGVLLKFIRGQKYAFIVYDVYPDIAVELGYLKRDGIITRFWEKLNKLVYGWADIVVVLGETMKEKINKYTDISKVEIIHNWADKDFIIPLKKEDNWFCKKYGLDGFVVMYSGNIGLFHDLETIIYAAKELEKEKIKFLIIGEGGKKEKLRQIAQELRLSNILFLPYQPREVLPHSLTAGDVSIVSLEKGLEGLAVPCKLYTSLAAGQAIIALVGEDSDVAEIIKKHECGIRVEEGDVKGFVNAVKTLMKDEELLNRMKANARRCFEENFDRQKALDKYYSVVLKLNG